MFREIKAIKGGKKIKSLVAEERELRLIVNDKLVASVKLSPGYEEEFALGYCFGEGLIESLNQVLGIRVEKNTAYVEVDASFEVAYGNYLLSDCISGWRAKIETGDVKVASDYRVKASEIAENMQELRKRSRVWRRTGGVHSVALVTGNNFHMVEDISRHIAVDKAIGLGIKKGVDFATSYILTSGRLPGDMVIKVARVGIPIIASRTAPLTSGIDCAQETNLTLIGFVRGREMNIYTNPERII
jgi:formate dehydrogenase accessory protein FdhD